MHEVKRQVNGLHPIMRAFSGNPAVRLLTFTSTHQDAFDIVGVSEAGAVRVLAYFMEVQAKEMLPEQVQEMEEEYESGRAMMGLGRMSATNSSRGSCRTRL